MSVAVNVHEHGAGNEKCVFVDACVLSFGYAGKRQNSPAQLVMYFFSWFHKDSVS
jgi:hypothetical protein